MKRTEINTLERPEGSIITSNLTSETGNYNCFILLEHLPAYSWCGLNFSTLALGGRDNLTIQSGVINEFEPVTQTNLSNWFYIPTLRHPLTVNTTPPNNIVQFNFQPGDPVSELPSDIALMYKGRYLYQVL